MEALLMEVFMKTDSKSYNNDDYIYISNTF